MTRKTCTRSTAGNLDAWAQEAERKNTQRGSTERQSGSHISKWRIESREPHCQHTVSSFTPIPFCRLLVLFWKRRQILHPTSLGRLDKDIWVKINNLKWICNAGEGLFSIQNDCRTSMEFTNKAQIIYIDILDILKISKINPLSSPYFVVLFTSFITLAEDKTNLQELHKNILTESENNFTLRASGCHYLQQRRR